MIHPTTSQIDEQVELERNQISQGLKRLRDSTIKLEDKLCISYYLWYFIY